MGDRCYVELTVLTEHLPQVLKITQDEDYGPCETREEDDATVLCFEEVNYGTLPWLGQLTNLGIAWDSRWHGGDEYGPGQKYLRFAPDGTIQTVEFADSEMGNIPTDTLLDFINLPDNTVDSIRTYVIDHMRSHDPLPWEGQVENGKRYLTLKLIGGT